MDMKHKNTSKWAKMALEHGKHDKVAHVDRVDLYASHNRASLFVSFYLPVDTLDFSLTFLVVSSRCVLRIMNLSLSVKSSPNVSTPIPPAEPVTMTMILIGVKTVMGSFKQRWDPQKILGNRQWHAQPRN